MKQFFLLAAWPVAALGFVSAARSGGAHNPGRETRHGAVHSAKPVFRSISTFKVAGKVAEIITASPDGKTLVYTDSAKHELGFIDASNTGALKQLGTLPVSGEPTSVAYAKNGRFVLAVVAGANELDIVHATTRTIVRRIPLGGQPDCIAISPDGRFAAIAIENERANMGASMPQMPAGYVVVLRMAGGPESWTTKKVSLMGRAGLRFPSDPEPEFIDIDAHGCAAVTLQENNAIALIDLPAAKLLRTFSCGTVTHAADTRKDGKVEFRDEIRNAPREPDGIGWTRGGNLVTANEGDYDTELKKGQFSGGRGFSLFAPSGNVLFDVGAGLEGEAAKAGLYPDKRSEKRGVEAEGVEITRMGGRDFAFITLERANAVAVYDISHEATPRFVQILPCGKAPEGVLALPGRNLFVTANEGDGTVSVFGL